MEHASDTVTSSYQNSNNKVENTHLKEPSKPPNNDTRNIEPSFLNGNRYQCGECSFSTKNTDWMAKRVKQIHRNEGLYICEKCQYSSQHEGRLISHMKKQHNIIR